MEEYFEKIAAVAGDIDDTVEDEEGAVCRLPYIVRQRQDPMHFYDDGEIVQKLRMSKRTVAYVLMLIEDQTWPESDLNAAISPTLQVLLTLGRSGHVPPRRGGPFRETNLCWVLKMPEKLKWAPSIDPRGSCSLGEGPL